MKANIAEDILGRRSIDANGCWNYTGTLCRGYGQAGFRGRSIRVHRLSASVFLGFEPESGLNVLHRCDNKRCFNPAHLFVGTQRDNVLDAIEKRRAPQFERGTHCYRGHLLTTENTMVRQGGGRRCRTCENAGQRRRAKARRIAVSS